MILLFSVGRRPFLVRGNLWMLVAYCHTERVSLTYSEGPLRMRIVLQGEPKRLICPSNNRLSSRS
jgi:hypothetical protein